MARKAFSIWPGRKAGASTHLNRKEPVIQEAAALNQPDGQNIKELFADFLEAIRTGRKPLCVN